MDEPGWVWPAWKFGFKRDDLFTTLSDQYNTFSCTIQDPEAFHHDVYEISNEADTPEDFHRLMAIRRQQRLKELNESLESAAVEIIANPDLIGTEKWRFAVQVFRTRSLDALVRYFSSYLPEHLSHSHSSVPYSPPSMASSTYSSFSDSVSVDTASTKATDVDGDQSFFENDPHGVLTHEPLCINTTISPVVCADSASTDDSCPSLFDDHSGELFSSPSIQCNQSTALPSLWLLATASNMATTKKHPSLPLPLILMPCRILDPTLSIFLIISRDRSSTTKIFLSSTMSTRQSPTCPIHSKLVSRYTTLATVNSLASISDINLMKMNAVLAGPPLLRIAWDMMQTMRNSPLMTKMMYPLHNYLLTILTYPIAIHPPLDRNRLPRLLIYLRRLFRLCALFLHPVVRQNIVNIGGKEVPFWGYEGVGRRPLTAFRSLHQMHYVLDRHCGLWKGSLDSITEPGSQSLYIFYSLLVSLQRFVDASFSLVIYCGAFISMAYSFWPYHCAVLLIQYFRQVLIHHRLFLLLTPRLLRRPMLASKKFWLS